MKNKENNPTGVRWVVSGVFIIALIILALQMVRIFKVWNIVEFAAIFGTFLSWLLVFWGLTQLMHRDKSLRRMWIVAIAVLVLVVAEGLVAFRNVKGGLLEQSFIDIGVMFLFYLTLLGLFYGYRKMLQWAAIAVKAKDALLARKCMRSWLPCCAIVMITLIFIPITGMFSRPVEYVGTSVLGLIGLLAQAYLCALLMQSYGIVSGKSEKEKSNQK